MQTNQLAYWASLALETRRFGHTYVHSAARAANHWAAFVTPEISFSFKGWGRSLSTGGHKYKVHARYTKTDKPVPSKVLRELIPRPAANPQSTE